MQNIINFCKKAAIFLPCIVLLAFSGSWIGMAVDFDSQSAESRSVISEVSREEIYRGPNPFEDFTFEKKEETRQPAAQPNPNYTVENLFFTSEESDIVLKKDACYVKNMTHLSADEVKNIMLRPVAFTVEKNSRQPQILIMHTHATESYIPDTNTPYDPSYAFRNTDTGQNMVAVGQKMARTLNSLGYNTIQDATLHDYPSYNGSYDNSKRTVEKYLEKYPSIKIVLDVHRDAVESDGRIINPVTSINGKEYAQIMIISGADNGYMNMPNYKENLKFASAVQNRAAKSYPGLMRPILFDYRNYNQQLTTGSILVEMGTHGSTLQQAINSAEAFAHSLAAALDEMS